MTLSPRRFCSAALEKMLSLLRSRTFSAGASCRNLNAILQSKNLGGNSKYRRGQCRLNFISRNNSKTSFLAIRMQLVELYLATPTRMLHHWWRQLLQMWPHGENGPSQLPTEIVPPSYNSCPKIRYQLLKCFKAFLKLIPTG